MSHYRSLDAKTITRTIETLHNRISERFTDRNLQHVCQDLHQIAEETEARIAWTKQPNWYLRGGIVLFIILIIAGGILAFSRLTVVDQPLELTEALGALEAGLNDIILIGAALVFLFTIEVRMKRQRTLDALHELRAVAHVIDMHQMTKDPTQLIFPEKATFSSPQENMNSFEMQRYLDYCSEMLSMVGKLAALYVQDFEDAVVISSVNEIESLASGLSRKIWQKIMIIQSIDQSRAQLAQHALHDAIPHSHEPPAPTSDVRSDVATGND